jgi:hypothetical protein
MATEVFTIPLFGVEVGGDDEGACGVQVNVRPFCFHEHGVAVKYSQKLSALQPRAVKIIEHNVFLSMVCVPPFSRSLPICSTVASKDLNRFSTAGGTDEDDDTDSCSSSLIEGDELFESAKGVWVSNPDRRRDVEEVDFGGKGICSYMVESFRIFGTLAL